MYEKKNANIDHTQSTEYTRFSMERYEKTLRVIEKYVSIDSKVLDIGPDNPFSRILQDRGYKITNTPADIDLDYGFDEPFVVERVYDVVTSFEVFEHLVNPFNILVNLNAKKLICSVPLNLWFKKAYWNNDDPYDRHYHEFESRQFDMLLDKAGWDIIHSEKWVSRIHEIGIRPILRRFTPRHYLVVAERKEQFEFLIKKETKVSD